MGPSVDRNVRQINSVTLGIFLAFSIVIFGIIGLWLNMEGRFDEIERRMEENQRRQKVAAYETVNEIGRYTKEVRKGMEKLQEKGENLFEMMVVVAKLIDTQHQIAMSRFDDLQGAIFKLRKSINASTTICPPDSDFCYKVWKKPQTTSSAN